MRARAIENQAYIFGVNRTGKDPYTSYSGGSCIISPKGEILAEEAGKALSPADPPGGAPCRAAAAASPP